MVELNPECRIHLSNNMFPIGSHVVRGTRKAFQNQRVPPVSDGTQKACNGPSRDKSTGVETSGVSYTFGELCPGDGDGGIGTVMGKYVACLIRD